MLVGWLIFLVTLLTLLTWAGKRMERIGDALRAATEWEDDQW